MKNFSSFTLVLLSMLFTSLNVRAIEGTGEYCCYYGDETRDGSTYVTLTWETASNGDVVITIGRGPGANSASFRNGGFEGGIDAFLVSTDDFVTSDSAKNYFTAEKVYSGNTFTLVKKADLPANAVIKHVGTGHALAWSVNGKNAYSFPDFYYIYGRNCNQWLSPTNVAVSADSIITFTEVVGAESYTAYVSLNGNLKYEQAVVSGDVLHFSPLASGTYQVTVVAFGNGKLESDPSAEVDWVLTAPELVLGDSEYCNTVIGSDDLAAAFTWITDNEGNVLISISSPEGAESADFHFRGNGMALGSFKVGSLDASTYFAHAASGNTVTLSLKDAANAPSKGEKITFNGVVEYTTTLNNNAWPTLQFEYVYGTTCPGGSAIDEVAESSSAKKQLIDGVLYIEMNGRVYNILGTNIK